MPARLKKYGTLLYRSNRDVLYSLSVALYKLSRATQQKGSSCERNSNLTPDPQCLNSLNSCIYQQIRKFLTADGVIPFRFDKLSIDSIISDIDPSLWTAVCTLTQSVSERRGTSKVSDPDSLAYHVKKVRRLFCLCSLLFSTDDQCYLPMHNLITDVTESFGGSSFLIKILNRLGICASVDTLARSIQFRVAQREKQGPEQECSPDSVTIVSADNIDFLHSYARVFCGNQTSSWHSITVQAVQPKPNLHVHLPTIREIGEGGDAGMCTETESCQEMSHALPTEATMTQSLPHLQPQTSKETVEGGHRDRELSVALPTATQSPQHVQPPTTGEMSGDVTCRSHNDPILPTPTCTPPNSQRDDHPG